MSKKTLIIQTSLSEHSKTEVVAKRAYELLKEKGEDVELINLKEASVPFCTGGKLEHYPQEVQDMYAKVEAADVYILAYPVYNYCFSGTCKNFIDIFSHAMSGKKLGIINNSSGVRSWNHGVAQLMASLGMHNNVTVVQPVVHSWKDDFEGDTLTGKKVEEKLHDMFTVLLS